MALDKYIPLDKLTSLMEIEAPSFSTLDEALDKILPQVRSNSEDLREEKFYLGKRWKEFRDTDDFVESVLHFYNGGGEYLVSIDGNIAKGSWRYLSEANCLLLEMGKSHELYDLAFMNDDFFILKKHGDQLRKGQKKYFVMANEGSMGGLDWRNLMESLFNIYRANAKNTMMTIFFLVLAGLLVALSLM